MGDLQPQPNNLPFNLTDVDRQVLSQTDEMFIHHDWDEIKRIIASNNLEAFRRKPSELKRYIAWTTNIKARYGTITNYILQERLKWQLDGSVPLASQCRNPVPFADPSDYRILRNDWPYGVSPELTHIVIWLKNSIPVREDNGDLTDESRTLINDFVNRTFVARLEKLFPDADDRVLWFKNWTALQSVRSLEHVHVVVRGVPDEIIVEWTGEQSRAVRFDRPRIESDDIEVS
ncbi:hypothetical protein RJZ56_007026 [Blastomyces dermatitidis]|uniref:N-acetylglucosamine-induced protein 1 n=3 Tax=Blastomyces TaxID=229219 RepID=A0A179UPE7_BLAGS|nr:uncharacterized protein BDBG_05635 [Blastomyces gilchristii SLH14081]XP_045274805.1 uncharacterized protein BDCG_02619 [Blastomyces dermatitidis ER-3]EGE77917.1 hypothetical protein BDDG_00854 [Blastomyces dermatitidis ATCC 18188]EQL38210.1 hypothetical protein BDFG_00584 [Blastomyces dermatitidis ATCC 26199]EEQ87499.1 hypothetical protein BDCG_02619 [Blastomyces dermatitidis ER-3]OAT09945.1 hypothetical protein BDBG_05635 [Blastomyces gilchristii SLH14081]